MPDTGISMESNACRAVAPVIPARYPRTMVVERGGRKESVVVVRDELVPVLCSLLSRRSSKGRQPNLEAVSQVGESYNSACGVPNTCFSSKQESSCIVAIAIPIDGPSTISLLYSIYTSGPPSSPP